MADDSVRNSSPRMGGGSNCGRAHQAHFAGALAGERACGGAVCVGGIGGRRICHPASSNTPHPLLFPPRVLSRTLVHRRKPLRHPVLLFALPGHDDLHAEMATLSEPCLPTCNALRAHFRPKRPRFILRIIPPSIWGRGRDRSPQLYTCIRGSAVSRFPTFHVSRYFPP